MSSAYRDNFKCPTGYVLVAMAYLLHKDAWDVVRKPCDECHRVTTVENTEKEVRKCENCGAVMDL